MAKYRVAHLPFGVAAKCLAIAIPEYFQVQLPVGFLVVDGDEVRVVDARGMRNGWMMPNWLELPKYTPLAKATFDTVCTLPPILTTRR